MTKDEALDLALEALEVANSLIDGYYLPKEKAWLPEIEEAITAIKQARSAPVQSCYCLNCEAMGKELAALKAQPAPVQEPVAWTVSGKITDWSKDFSAYQTKHYTRPVYTPPAAQRQWTGLTDEEVYPLANKHLHYQIEGYEVSGIYDLARAIEAKLKEKNT